MKVKTVQITSIDERDQPAKKHATALQQVKREGCPTTTSIVKKLGVKVEERNVTVKIAWMNEDFSLWPKLTNKDNYNQDHKS